MYKINNKIYSIELKNTTHKRRGYFAGYFTLQCSVFVKNSIKITTTKKIICIRTLCQCPTINWYIKYASHRVHELKKEILLPIPGFKEFNKVLCMMYHHENYPHQPNERSSNTVVFQLPFSCPAVKRWTKSTRKYASLRLLDKTFSTHSNTRAVKKHSDPQHLPQQKMFVRWTLDVQGIIKGGTPDKLNSCEADFVCLV